jgi:translocation and assembly module TamB
MAGYQIPVSITDTMDLSANTTLKLEGAWKQAKLKGTVEIIEGFYYKDVQMDILHTLSGVASELTRRKRVTTPKTVEVPSNPFLKNLRLSIAVGARNPIEVDNNLAEFSLRPDLLVRGPVYQPIITGRAAVEEGVVYYQNNRFIIERGVIDFINPQRTTPEFDIGSEVRVRDWLINLKVTGPPDALEFELSSSPPLDDQDILSLLLSGKTYNELVAGEGGNTRATARMLADLIVSQYGETIKSATGLDIIETVPSDPDDQGNAGVKVTLGKNLTERMQLKYNIEDRGGELEGRVTAEYRFLENIFLSGFQENTGAFGGALTYRLEFR